MIIVIGFRDSFHMFLSFNFRLTLTSHVLMFFSKYQPIYIYCHISWRGEQEKKDDKGTHVSLTNILLLLLFNLLLSWKKISRLLNDEIIDIFRFKDKFIRIRQILFKFQ